MTNRIKRLLRNFNLRLVCGFESEMNHFGALVPLRGDMTNWSIVFEESYPIAC